MTLSSTLFPAAGGGGVPYPAGTHILSPWPNTMATQSQVDQDILLPFVPRYDVTIDKLWYYRNASTAGNVYMGAYDNSGNLLSDCAVDSDTTIGLHEIDSTNFDLTAGNLYYWMFNQSAAVIGGDATGGTDEENAFLNAYAHANPFDLAMFSGGTFPSNGRARCYASKTRTNAAPIDPITMSGWDVSTRVYIFGGVTA